MADAFQPRFVDLVRNYTLTSGTGDLVVGAAVPGFASFTSALQPGDRFYYSIVGITDPAETEVGRGTMGADGSIAREPVGGVATDFSPGTKTVALIAAAEWFGRMEAVAAAGAQVADGDKGDISIAGGAWTIDPDAPNVVNKLRHVADRASLAAAGGTAPAAYLREAGREGAFVWDPSDRSGEVAADTAQGMYVAPEFDATGASGAWVRKFEGPIDPAWFGLVEGDDPANGAANDAAIQAALSTLRLAGPYHLRFPFGTYWFASTIELAHGNMILEGAASAGTSASGVAVLKFPSGVTGIRVHGDQTSGANAKDSVAHGSAFGSTIRNVAVEGAFGGTEAEAHGIQLRTKATILCVTIRNFEGDGLHGAANSNAADGAEPPFGNINLSRIERVTIRGCRNGLFLDGADANGLTVTGVDAADCRQWGIWDSSFLGNSYVGGQVAHNGMSWANDGVAIGASVVSDGTNRYFAIAGQEAGASTNPPSGDTTDNAWWAYLCPGGTGTGVPLWRSGLSVRAGGAICDDDENSQSVYSGVYVEEGQGKAQVVQDSMVLGGMLALQCFQNPAMNKGTALLRGATHGRVHVEPALELSSGEVTVNLGNAAGNDVNLALSAVHASQAPFGYSLWFSANDLLLSYDRSTENANVAFSVTGPGTAEEFGTGAAVAHALFAPRLMVGDTVLTARLLTNGTAAPSTGAHGAGELVLARDDSGNRVGWKCTGAGEPGTWAEMFALTQLQAAGSGLSLSSGDRLLGRATAGAGPVEEIVCTAAGRALLDDADPTAQRATLGLGSIATAAAGDYLAVAGNLSELGDPAAARANLDVYSTGEVDAAIATLPDGGDPLATAAEWAPNFTADGDVYIPAVTAMTIHQGNAPVGTGALAYEQSTAAAPGSFTATALPAALEAGAWLKVSATGVSGFLAAHLRRTA